MDNFLKYTKLYNILRTLHLSPNYVEYKFCKELLLRYYRLFINRFGNKYLVLSEFMLT
jgi:hypothetical protein